MNTYTFKVTKTFVVTVAADNEYKAREQVQEDINDGGYSRSIDVAEPELELIDQELEEPGFVVYIKDADYPDMWERSKEVPGVYPTTFEAYAAINKFLDLAEDAGFSYEEADFKVLEKFIPPKE